MKKNISIPRVSACLLSLLFLFSSCLKDNCRHAYKIYTPVYEKLTALRAGVQSKSALIVSHPGKLYINGSWIFLNEQNKGVHVIDNSNPAHPVNAAFINIPGNIDMAVKGDILYADLYSDLAAINISDPKHITVAKFLTNAFPERSSNPGTSNPDSINIITDWTTRDTVVSCGQDISSCNNCSTNSTGSMLFNASAANTNMAGSMARFATVDNYMYTVNTSSLNVIDIHAAANPLFVQQKNIGWSIETIFPYDNKLYIGAGNNMSMYDLQNPADPQPQSWVAHWCSGDPVVADKKYAYVTLHQANVCGSTVNELQIYNTSTTSNAILVKVYPLTNPQGLSKDGNLLFVCDDGLKIYDATDALNLKLIKHIAGTTAYDVIAGNGIACLVAKDGLYQYDYSDPQNIHLLSKLLK